MCFQVQSILETGQSFVINIAASSLAFLAQEDLLHKVTFTCVGDGTWLGQAQTVQ